MNPRDVVRLAHDLRGQPLAAVDAELHRRHLDAETRLQVKLELQAAGAPTVKAAFELATDTAVGHQERTTRPKTTMERLLDRVGIDDQRQYTEPELNELLAQAGLDLEQRLAVKIECESLRLIRHTSVTDRLLQQLGIDGPHRPAGAGGAAGSPRHRQRRHAHGGPGGVPAAGMAEGWRQWHHTGQHGAQRAGRQALDAPIEALAWGTGGTSSDGSGAVGNDGSARGRRACRPGASGGVDPR
jgi:hypothetical protein